MDSSTTITANTIATGTIAANTIIAPTGNLNSVFLPADACTFSTEDLKHINNYNYINQFKNPIYYTSNYSKIMCYNTDLDLKVPYITKVEVLKPGKVMRFTFSDKTEIKTVCTDADDFNFKFAFYLAYAKYLYKNVLTPAGIEKKAKEFMDIVFFNSLVKKGMRIYLNQKKEEERLEKAKAESKAIRERRIAKKIAKKARAKEARINEIAAAIKKAKKDEWVNAASK